MVKPNKAITNQIWLAFRKPERQAHKIQMLHKFMCTASGSSH
jgi:hypothetical protein